MIPTSSKKTQIKHLLIETHLIQTVSKAQILDAVAAAAAQATLLAEQNEPMR